MPKVSILVPVYNVEIYLAKCLESLISQSLRDIEIICINDGSTDSSLKILREFANQDKRIRILDKENTGYGDSMNLGLEHARGEFIGIVESDDWAEKSMFARLYREAKKHNAQIVKAEFYEFYSNEQQRGVPQRRKSNLLLEHESNRVLNPRYNPHIFFQQPSIWSGIYSRDFLNQSRIRFTTSAGASYQDTAFSFKTFAAATRVLFLKDAYLHYRQDNAQSSVKDSGNIFAVSHEYEEIERFLRSPANDETRLLKIMRATRWGAYRWNIERLDPSLAEEFILYASSQYKSELTSRSFNFEFCDANFSREIEELINRPDMVLARRLSRSVAKVSVVFPVYNVEKTVKASLESVLQQTLQEIEIIVVDDGSTDASSQIVEEFFQNDSRVRLLTQPNAGLSVARNSGIAQAAAPFISFLDSDDEYYLDALERLLDAAIESKAELVIGASKVVFESDSSTANQRTSLTNYLRVKNRGMHKISPEVLNWTDVHVWNKLFRRSKIEELELKFPAGIHFEDSFFLNTYAWNSETAFFLDPESPVHIYYRRMGTIMDTTVNGADIAFDHLRISFLLLRELNSEPLRQKFGDYFLELFATNIRLSLDYLGLPHHEQIWRQAREFFATHYRELESLNPEHFQELNEMLFSRSWLRALLKFPKIGALISIKNNLKSRQSPS